MVLASCIRTFLRSLGCAVVPLHRGQCLQATCAHWRDQLSATLCHYDYNGQLPLQSKLLTPNTSAGTTKSLGARMHNVCTTYTPTHTNMHTHTHTQLCAHICKSLQTCKHLHIKMYATNPSPFKPDSKANCVCNLQIDGIQMHATLPLFRYVA